MNILKGNRTRLFSYALGILGIVEMFGREVIPESYQGLSLMIIAIAIFILRQITTTPPGEKY